MYPFVVKYIVKSEPVALSLKRPVCVCTVGVSNLETKIQVNKNDTVTLNIWDTAGQEQYSALIPMFSRDSNVCILVADYTKPETIDHLQSWLDRLHKNGENPPYIAVINKIDLGGPKELIRTELKSKFNNIIFSSAKTGQSIIDIFLTTGRLALESSNDIQESYPKNYLRNKKVEIILVANNNDYCSILLI